MFVGFNSAGGVDVRGFEFRRWRRCLSLVSDVCCRVEVSATSLSLVRRSPTNYGVSECDRKASVMRRPWPTRGFYAIGWGMYNAWNSKS